MKFWNYTLRWGVAALAAAVSAAFAATISDNEAVTKVLVVLSIVCVLIETNALPWIRQRRAENDRAGARLGLCLLTLACIYTAGMQIGFFGDVLMAPGAADKATASSLINAEKRVSELEAQRGWLVRPAGTTASLQQLVDGYAAQKKLSTKDADALRQARADLAAAKGADEIDAKIIAARADVARLKGAKPHDAKAAVFGWLSRGVLQGDAVTNLFVLLAVLTMQFGQVVLPIVAGGHRVSPGAGKIPELAASGSVTLGKPTDPPAPLALMPGESIVFRGAPNTAPAGRIETPPPRPAAATPAPSRPVSARVAAKRPKKPATRQARAEPPPFDLPVNPAANVVQMPPRVGSLRDRIRKVS